MGQQHEATVGLGEGVEQAVEQPREDIGERERRADRPIDAQHRPEFGLGVLVEPLVERGPWDVNLRHDHGVGARCQFVLVVEVVVDHDRCRRLVGRRIEEDQNVAADREFVAVLEPPGPGERNPVEQRAVATPQILGHDALGRDRQGAVLAAHCRGVEHDVAVGVAADEDPPGIEHEPLAAAGTGLELEDWHGMGRRGGGERSGSRATCGSRLPAAVRLGTLDSGVRHHWGMV